MHYEPPYYPCGAYPSRCTPVCGDGVVVGEEGSKAGRCDDGNLQDGDGCDSSCLKECGWTCSGGNVSKCNTQCGDGLRAGLEQCDDGNPENGDGCSMTCKVEAGWACSSATCKASTCLYSICGDGVRSGDEQCDDGDMLPDDGCSSTCIVECGFTCTRGDGQDTCSPTCGDRVMSHLVEGCDDGNRVSGDGCSSDCTVENLWSCSQVPCSISVCFLIQCGYTCGFQNGISICSTFCGDAKLAGLEQCDDGNTVNGDGCSSACKIESGWSCTDVVCQRSSCSQVSSIDMYNNDVA
jgi:cysteine-rich repeat protein